MPDEKKSLWNSLEIAKLLVTPLVVTLLGYFVQSQLAEQARVTQELLAAQARSWQQNQRMVERRLQVYDAVRVELNRIYCFVEDVGDWKNDNPGKVLGYKRHVDSEMFSQQAVWAPDTFAAYREYMSSAFDEFGAGPGKDATIQTTSFEKRIGIKGWKIAWEKQVTGNRNQNHRANYNRLQNLLARDMAIFSNGGG